MKPFLLSILLTSTLFGSYVLGEDPVNQPLPPPATPDSSIHSVQVPAKKLEISLKIEPLSDEQQQAGLNIDDIRNQMVQSLQNAGISVNDAIFQPVATLRIRTIQSGLDYATFFQLSLQEESMLVRNRSTFNAVTWSQGSLLACRPEDLKKESMETIDTLTQSFSKDFIKAFQKN